MFAQGFVIKKELINGKSVNEEGKMGILNKQGARIVEVIDGKAKYTELSHQDIKNLISLRSDPSDLMERLIPLLKRKKHRRRHTKHHVRHHAKHTKHHTKHHTRRHQPHGVASGHTKKHKKRQHKRKRKRKRTKHRKRR